MNTGSVIKFNTCTVTLGRMLGGGFSSTLFECVGADGDASHDRYVVKVFEFSMLLTPIWRSQFNRFVQLATLGSDAEVGPHVHESLVLEKQMVGVILMDRYDMSLRTYCEKFMHGPQGAELEEVSEFARECWWDRMQDRMTEKSLKLWEYAALIHGDLQSDRVMVKVDKDDEEHEITDLCFINLSQLKTVEDYISERVVGTHCPPPWYKT